MQTHTHACHKIERIRDWSINNSNLKAGFLLSNNALLTPLYPKLGVEVLSTITFFTFYFILIAY
jgi:hypothetical protein